MKNKFLFFLILSLSLTAFLAGYVMVKRGADVSYKTGTILDKFSDQQQTTTDNQQPITELNGPILLADRKVVSVTSSLNKGGVLYFEKNTGKLYEYNLNEKIEKIISDKMLPNFISALWSPTKEEIIGSFTSSAGIVFKYLNFKTGQEVDLDKSIRSVAFSPDGHLMVYHSLDNSAESDASLPDDQVNPSNNDLGNIIISQPDGQYQKKVLTTRIKEMAMSWPSRENMAFKTPSYDMFLLTEDGKLAKLLERKLGLEEKWSPNGSKLIFSALSDDPNAPDMKLWVKDVASREEKELISSLASRCVWSIDSINIYCVIAKSPSIDEIYLINTADGSSKLLAEPNMQVMEVFLSAVEDHLLFISASDEKLYSIKISE